MSLETKKKAKDRMVGNKLWAGKHHTNAAKTKISIANKGKKRTDEFKQKLRELHIGKRASEETKCKMSERMKGNVYLLGHRHSEMTRLKIQTKNLNRTKKLMTTSIYKGVYFHKKTKRWMARIKQNKTTQYLGIFVNEKDAALAYNKKAIELYGNKININKI